MKREGYFRALRRERIKISGGWEIEEEGDDKTDRRTTSTSLMNRRARKNFLGQ